MLYKVYFHFSAIKQLAITHPFAMELSLVLCHHRIGQQFIVQSLIHVVPVFLSF